ncbi:MAG: hypothetical protein U1E70_13185, partial [Acetobacteraceae bacterium]
DAEIQVGRREVRVQPDRTRQQIRATLQFLCRYRHKTEEIERRRMLGVLLQDGTVALLSLSQVAGFVQLHR